MINYQKIKNVGCNALNSKSSLDENGAQSLLSKKMEKKNVKGKSRRKKLIWRWRRRKYYNQLIYREKMMRNSMKSLVPFDISLSNVIIFLHLDIQHQPGTQKIVIIIIKINNLRFICKFFVVFLFKEDLVKVRVDLFYFCLRNGFSQWICHSWKLLADFSLHLWVASSPSILLV